MQPNPINLAIVAIAAAEVGASQSDRWVLCVLLWSRFSRARRPSIVSYGRQYRSKAGRTKGPTKGLLSLGRTKGVLALRC